VESLVATKNGQTRNLDDVPEAWHALRENVIGAAMEVHRALGPGMLERMYEAALCHELRLRSVALARQKSISMRYKGLALGEHVLDLVVDELLSRVPRQMLEDQS
jgi:hypothetical protein